MVSYCNQKVRLPGEVVRLLSEIREENRALWRDIKRLGGRIPPHIAGTLAPSASSHLHSLSLPSSQGQEHHTLSFSRFSSNFRGVLMETSTGIDAPGSSGPGGGPSGDAFGGVGGLSPLSLGGPSPSLHPHSPSLHAHSPSPQPPSPSGVAPMCGNRTQQGKEACGQTCLCHPDV